MIISIRRSIVIYGFLIGSAVPQTSRADSPGRPQDFQVKSANGAYVLVVFPTYKYVHRDPALRARYKASGVYLSSKPGKPIYTISPKTRTGFLSNNGKYIVELGPWAQRASDTAFTFYANGKKLKEYRIEQLVADQLALPRSVSHFQWLKEARLNDAPQEFLAVTLDNRRYTFALSTGNLKSGQLVNKVDQPEAISLYLSGNFPALKRLGKAGQEQLRDTILARRDLVAAQIVPALSVYGLDALPSLEIVSNHQDALVRQIAVEMAGEYCLPQTAPLLRAKLNDSVFTVRLAAISGLYNLGSPDEAVPAALKELQTASKAQKDAVIYGLRRVHARELIPAMIENLGTQPDFMDRAQNWLHHATFQKFTATRSDASTKTAWRTWWEKNQQTSPEDWYWQAIGRTIADLRKPDYESSVQELTNLTGHNIQTSSQSAAYKAWTQWWAANKSKRPAQILIASLKPDDYFPQEGQEILQRFVTAQDVPALVALYEKADILLKHELEQILRPLTGVDSMGMLSADDQQKVIAAWKQWIKEHPASQPTA